MRSTTWLLTIFLFISWLSGCGGAKDEASEVELVPPQQQTPEKTDGDFFPLKVGNEWIYSLPQTIISGTFARGAIENQTVVSTKIINGVVVYGITFYHPDTDGPILNPNVVFFYSNNQGEVIWHKETSIGSGNFTPIVLWNTHVQKGERFESGDPPRIIEVTDISEDGTLITFTDLTIGKINRTVFKKGRGLVSVCQEGVETAVPQGTCTVIQSLIWLNCEKDEFSPNLLPECTDDFWR